MSRSYTQQPSTVARVRDLTDDLRRLPEWRNAGLGARREHAAQIVAAVDALLSVERGPEGVK